MSHSDDSYREIPSISLSLSLSLSCKTIVRTAGREEGDGGGVKRGERIPPIIGHGVYIGLRKKGGGEGGTK